MFKRLYCGFINVFSVLFSSQVLGADIYMKSGNVIRLRYLKELNILRSGEDITEVSWVSLTNGKLIHVNVSQIEAITQR